MTGRKDFVALAEAFRFTKPRPGAGLLQWKKDVLAVAGVLAANNKTFDYPSWVRACYSCDPTILERPSGRGVH